MTVEKIAVLAATDRPHAGQDGAFWGDILFRFDADGTGWAYDARPLDTAGPEAAVELPRLAVFHTDPGDAVVPHFNAVAFGSEYYAAGDEFPLLYANLYNNYAAQADRREGVCCVYRLQRTADSFTMTLVQVIRIGFVKDAALWCSPGEKADVRPYGNFVIDRQKNILYAFTMRDAAYRTRYFAFALPKLADGVYSAEYGVNVVTLTPEDIRACFDTEYHRYVQGACCHEGKIYSSEGFDVTPPPALRVIDPAAEQQLVHMDLAQLGFEAEAEWIDFRGDICYYSDAPGNVYRVDFAL